MIYIPHNDQSFDYAMKDEDAGDWLETREDLEIMRTVGATFFDSGPETAVQRAESDNRVRRAYRLLPKRSRTVLRLRFGLDGCEPRTPREVGIVLEVGPERIRRIQDDALRSLRLILVGTSTTLDRLLSEGDAPL